MATTQDISNGMFIRYNGELCQIIEWQHRTPGNLRAFYQARMRRVKDGKLAENRFRSGEEVIIVRVETHELQFLYEEGDSFICMNNETFDQVPIPKFMFGDGAKFMKEGDEVLVSFEGELPIGATAPSHVVLEITYSEPGVRGDTATNTLNLNGSCKSRNCCCHTTRNSYWEWVRTANYGCRVCNAICKFD
jgi:elongation factor P